MKKIVSMIVVSVMAMSLCACTGKADQSASAGGSSVQQSEEFTEQLSTDSAAESEAESTEGRQLVLLPTVQAVIWKFRPGSKALSV